jgi:hypothetical protein
MSFLALLLEVPKGTLPTLTGRHKALRVCPLYPTTLISLKTQEKLVQERLNVISQLSTFLPPQLAQLISPSNGGVGISADQGLKFWSTQDTGERWWSVEDLGRGASVVKSKRNDGGGEKEVWVLRSGEGEAEGEYVDFKLGLMGQMRSLCWPL